MRKLKITLAVFYALLACLLIYESALPSSISAKQNSFFKKLINNISSIFIKNKYVYSTDILIENTFNDNYYVEDTLTLNTKVLPEKSSYKTISYTSTNTSILEVNQKGEVEFVGIGNAIIILEQKESKIKKEIKFNVLEKQVDSEILPTSLDFRTYDDNYTIAVGDYTYFKTIQSPSNVTQKKCTFTVSDETIANVFGHYIFALKEGVVTVTCTHDYADLTATKTITITSGEIKEPTVYELEGRSEFIYKKNTTAQFNFTIDDEASNIYKRSFFYAYDPINHKKSDIIDIDEFDGSCEILNYGVADIFVLTYDWSYYKKIRVYVRNILPTYSFDNQRLVLGNSKKIEVNPTNGDVATYFDYIYESSDENIATVDAFGNITAKKCGTTHINVIVNDGLDKYESGFDLTIINNDIENNVKFDFGKFIRKGLAHFMGFITFGFVSFFLYILCIEEYRKKINMTYVVILINGLVFAILTEVIQIFVPGRDGTIKDVLLDYSGYLIAFIIAISIYLIYKMVKKHKENNNKTNSEELNE